MRVEGIIILLAIFIALASSKTASKFRIFNGKDAMDGQFPYQASLRNKDSLRVHCGGAIISNRFVLTAAHCCYDEYSGPEYTVVVVGALRQSIGGKAMDVDKMIPHEAFDPMTGKNDIALVRTVENIKFTEKIQSIALPNSDVVDGKQVVASGWGTNGYVDYDILQYIEVITLNLLECEKAYNLKNYDNHLYDSNLCTIGIDKTRSPCEGDSGNYNIWKYNASVGAK